MSDQECICRLFGFGWIKIWVSGDSRCFAGWGAGICRISWLIDQGVGKLTGNGRYAWVPMACTNYAEGNL